MRLRLFLRMSALTVAIGVAWAVATTATTAATLHVLFVIDTDDRNIGDMVARDLAIMGGEVQKIVAATGLTLNDRVYKGGDFTTANVKGAVRALSPGRDDVVLFYYSGHGFRTKTKKSKWPYLFFSKTPQNPVDFGWVAEEMSRKGARLTIVMTDSCNNVVNLQVRETQKALPAVSAKARNGYRDLFLKHRGFIAAASSIPGETSTATQSGSLFTLSFLKALRNEVLQPQATWQSLMRNGAGSRLNFSSSSGRTLSQKPFYTIQTARIGTQPPQPPAVQPPPPPVQPPAPTVRPPQPTVPPPPPVQPPPQPSQPGGWQVIN